jgi:hypothetical protein
MARIGSNTVAKPGYLGGISHDSPLLNPSPPSSRHWPVTPLAGRDRPPGPHRVADRTSLSGAVLKHCPLRRRTASNSPEARETSGSNPPSSTPAESPPSCGGHCDFRRIAFSRESQRLRRLATRLLLEGVLG